MVHLEKCKQGPSSFEAFYTIPRRLTITDSKRNPDELVLHIMAALYYDINHICLMQNAVRRNPRHADAVRYGRERNNVQAFIKKAVVHMKVSSHPESEDADQVLELRFITMFISKLGWKMFAICAHAEAFRRACREVKAAVWRKLMDKIEENRHSIETFASLRKLDWRALMDSHADSSLPSLRAALQPQPNIYNGHIHHTARTLNNGTRHPVYIADGVIHFQEHIDRNSFDPANWPDGDSMEDPTVRGLGDGRCHLCLAPENCDCRVASLAGNLMELVEYENKGIGIRALANIPKGVIIGEYVGELFPNDYEDDPIYALDHNCRTVEEEDGKRRLQARATISSKHYGNWTRFPSHSCKHHCVFMDRVVGDRTVTTVEVQRNIGIFEELTISYGKDYWRNKTCLCGEANCISKRKRHGTQGKPAGKKRRKLH